MAKAYVKHDYAVTGRDYVETEGGGGGDLTLPKYTELGDDIAITETPYEVVTGGWYKVFVGTSGNNSTGVLNINSEPIVVGFWQTNSGALSTIIYIPAGAILTSTITGSAEVKINLIT